MFEVGRTYKVTTKDGDETGYITRTVLEVNLPLVKFSTPGNYIIINTAAPSFVSAIPNDAAAKESEAAAIASLRESFEVRLTRPDGSQVDSNRYDELDGDGPKAGH